MDKYLIYINRIYFIQNSKILEDNKKIITNYWTYLVGGMTIFSSFGRSFLIWEFATTAETASSMLCRPVLITPGPNWLLFPLQK